jgi:hypothetical protein
MNRTDLVLVKAFGDLVIALTAVGRAPAATRARYRLLIGHHLVPLFEAIGEPIEYQVLAHGGPGVPAMYDLRRCGVIRAVHSAWKLRRLIAATAPSHLLFDRLGARERWLAAGTAADPLPAAANIYLAYEAALGFVPATSMTMIRRRDIGIFPGSRIAAKNLTEAVVRMTITAIEGAGFVPRLFLLEGERPDLEGMGLPHRILPRSFAAMVTAVMDCGAIVSADSVPAHVAEQRGVPVHVISPVDNRYWLPRSAFLLNRWSLFDADIGGEIGSFLVALEKEHA